MNQPKNLIKKRLKTYQDGQNLVKLITINCH